MYDMTFRGREKRSKSVERTKEDSKESLFGRFTFFRNCNRQCKENPKNESEEQPQNSTLGEDSNTHEQNQQPHFIPVTRSNRRRHEAIEESSNNWDSRVSEKSLSSSYPGHSSPRSLSPEPCSNPLQRSYPKNNGILSKRVGYNIGTGIRNLSALISGTPGRFAETMSGIRASSSCELSKLTSPSVSDAFSRDYGELSRSFNGLDSPICITPRVEGSQSSLSEKSDVNIKFELSPVSSRTVTQTGSSSNRSILSVRNSTSEKVVDNTEIQVTSNNEGIEQLDFLTVHRGDGKTQIELHRGRIDKLSRRDRVDYLLVARVSNSENGDRSESAQVFDCSNVLEVHGLNVDKIQQLSKDLKSFRQSYNCWISCKLQKEKLNPPGFEYERMLFHEDIKNSNVEPLFQIVLDTFRCLAALIAYNMTAKSILIPLCGGDFSRCKNYRVDALKVILEVATVYAACGLPLRSIKILLPENTSIESERRHFARAREEWQNFYSQPILLGKMERKNFLYDCLLLHSQTELKQVQEIKSALQDMKADSQSIDCVASVQSGATNIHIFKTLFNLVFSSRKIVALISPNFMQCLCCQVLFSLAFCRSLESKGNVLLPVVWEKCLMSPLVRRTVSCQGINCDSQEMSVILGAICKFVSSEVNSSELKNDKVGTVRLHSGEILEKRWEDETANEVSGQHERLKQECSRNENWQCFETNNLNDFEFQDEESILSSPLFTLSSLPEWKSRWNIDPTMLEVGPRIGVGGSGEVFKATYQRQVVAVKLLIQDEDQISSDALLDFKGEMLLMSGLNHPNVVKFIGAVNASNNICLVTEFVSGGCLYRYIARKRANGEIFPLKDYLKIALDIAKGMEYLHAQTPRVIHMDLKSPNVLLSPHSNGCTAKIADFGLSCRLDRGLRNTGFGGTAEWMAPEMMRQEQFDEKVDVFSFGVILWELVTGEKPWGNDHPTHIIRKVSLEGQRLIVPLDIQQRIPKEVNDLIDQCQNAIAANRPSFSDCVQVLKDLCFREG
ncbi:hypothetical protein GpartN1_g18.t1 [Galdieria partita]|uniref:Protein kinase domain-containing protein n=1 Tax=Galdieria partita TaxID=83374 RepID=A0A9C7UM57_9RHOD|nr:hypothetical protein GpartN1_g18.t1 [Galdieria partita]